MVIIDTKLYQSSIKVFPDYFDMEHYCSVLFQYKENEWFSPNNLNDESFTICKELNALGLIARKEVPDHSAGMYRGMTIKFFYNKNLDYKNEF